MKLQASQTIGVPSKSHRSVNGCMRACFDWIAACSSRHCGTRFPMTLGLRTFAHFLHFAPVPPISPSERLDFPICHAILAKRRIRQLEHLQSLLSGPKKFLEYLMVNSSPARMRLFGMMQTSKHLAELLGWRSQFGLQLWLRKRAKPVRSCSVKSGPALMMLNNAIGGFPLSAL